jgi:hypothetical protein
LTDYKANMLQLLHTLFGDSSNYSSHASWIELYGLVLSFHLYRWNKAMCNNDFSRLNHQFLLEWEGQGFKSRVVNLMQNRQRLPEFQGTVAMLNFFCRSCRRFGSITHYCDAVKCAARNRPLHGAASIKEWTKRFEKWKSARPANEPKTRNAFEQATGDVRPPDSGASEIWPAVMAAQNLVAPQGSPNMFSFAI